LLVVLLLATTAAACGKDESGPPVINWYAFDEPGGSFIAAAEDCTEQADGRYRIEVRDLPADANQQREQLVRRLAAGDSSIDLMGMDVIWTAEFAGAGWLLPYDDELATQVTDGTIETIVDSVRYQDQIWAAPFTSNTQLLWYRDDRVRGEPPATWDQMIQQAEEIGEGGLIQAQGQRYEGLTVLFNSLLVSAGGSILDRDGEVALQEEPTRRALEIMRDLGQSSAADPALATSLEDQSRLAFESGSSAFMVNYPFVYPSARENTPELFDHLKWARWPGVYDGEESRVTIGGFNLGVSAFTEHPDLAFEAAACIVDPRHQKTAAIDGGLPPTNAELYDDPEIRDQYPFADLIRSELQNGAIRPVNPIYNDISLAVQRTLHPMSSIDPDADLDRLREAIGDALESRGLL
jgi:multiple sugar transport system substrate-binding protein